MSSRDQLKQLIDNLRNILRNEEGITGMDAMRDICRFIALKYMDHLITDDPLNGIDLLNTDYYEEEVLQYLDKCKFSQFAQLHGSELETTIYEVWKNIYRVHPMTKFIFEEPKKFKSERTLETIIAEIIKYNLDTATTDVLGDIYEYFLSQLSTAKDLGQFFTNRKIIDFALNTLFEDIPIENDPVSIYDPCAGTCGFLTQAYKKIHSMHPNSEINCKGNDIQTDTVILGSVNMLMNTQKLHEIEKRDSLREQDDIKYDYIVTNPPFGLKPNWKELEKRYTNNMALFKKLYPHKTTSSVELFIESLLPKMNAGMCMVVPFGSEMNGKRSTQIAFRKSMMENYHLYKMILLPGGIFEYTNIQTAIMFWKPQAPTDRDSTLEFLEIDPGFKLNKKTLSRLGCLTNYLKPIITINKQELEKHSYSLNPKEYTRIDNVFSSEVVIKTMDELFEFKKGTFTTTEMDNEGNIPFYNCSYNNPIGFNSKSTYDNPNEYLLIIMSGNILNKSGDIGIGKIFKVIGPNAFVGDVTALIPKSGVNINYLYWYLTINKINLLDLAKTVTGLGHIGIADLKNFKIPLPDPRVQAAIVARIEALQNQLNGFKMVIDNLQDEMRYAMHLETRNISNIKKVSELFTFEKKSARKAGEALEEGQFNFYTSSDVVKKINEADYTKLGIIVGTGGNPNVKLDSNFSCSADNIIISNEDQTLMVYSYLWMMCDMDKFQELFTGLGIKHLSIENFKNLEIPIPDTETQKIIIQNQKTIKQNSDNLLDNLNKQIKIVENKQKLSFESFVSINE
jgi:type I restriction-modification system DNA methylase subunit